MQAGMMLRLCSQWPGKCYLAKDIKILHNYWNLLKWKACLS